MGVVSVSLCEEQAIALCRALREADGRFHIGFEYIPLEGCCLDPKVLLRAVGTATSLSKKTRVVAVPHPGFSGSKRCIQQSLLEDVINGYLTAGTAVCIRLADRLEACEDVTQRPVQEEALSAVTGGNWGLRPAAQEFGTPLNGELYKLQTKFMRDEAATFLQDPSKCANAAEAFAAYTAVSSQPGAFVYVADTFWNAMCEAQKSAGYKRPRAVGSFLYSDTYWGYDWGQEQEEEQQEEEQQEEEQQEVKQEMKQEVKQEEEDKEGGPDEQLEELAIEDDKQHLQQQLVLCQQTGPAVRKRPRRSARMAA